MKFTISTVELKKKFAILANGLALNPIVPSLENYLVEFCDEKIYITSSDLHTYIKANVEMIDFQDISLNKFCMPAKMLNDIVKSLDDQNISFFINVDTFGMQLETKNGVYKLVCESAADFPQLKDELSEQKQEFNFIAKKLKSIFSSLLVTTSNKNELSPSITGMFFEKKGEEVKFVTTDEHRISIYGLEKIANKDDKNFSLILPKRSVSIISAIMPSENVRVRIEANETALKASVSGIEIYIKAMKEKFPNYNLVIPKDADKSIIINKKNLLTSLRRTAIFSNKSTRYALVVVENNTSVIVTKDMDFNSEATEAVQCDYEGEKIMSGFNVLSLADLISTLDSDFLEINIKDNNSPCVIKPASMPENESHIALIMPMIQGN